MLPKIKSVSVAKSRFQKRVQVAAPDYEAGISAPRYDWLEEFKSAWERIRSGLQEAIEEGRIPGGAERRGTAYWQARTKRKGPPRWREETPKAADTWESEVKPFFETIAAVPLEAKRKKGDPANIEGRVKPIVQALYMKKKELRGARRV